mmetsp:Transcript_7790/g.10865  ORF Transcript_7790/g.10865 Transcript_7790/m.10865 type:complete len:502 (-) Transcript_7790:99-1604(-)
MPITKETIAIPAILLVIGLLIFKKRKTKHWPPVIIEKGWLENMKAMSSTRAPEYLLQIVRSYKEKCFVLRFPLLQPYIVCADVTIARAVLESKVSEKPKMFYQEFSATTCGYPTVFTLQTQAPAWAHQRKGMAPAFSGRNVDNAINSDHCNQVIQDLYQTLNAFDKADKTIDLAQLMTATTIDLLGAVACGGMRFNTLIGEMNRLLQAEEKGIEMGLNLSQGADVLRLIEPCLREFAGARLMNPYRKYYSFLFKEARKATTCAKHLMNLAQKILNDYYTKNPQNNQQEDQSILGRIANSKVYKTNAHRAADVVTLLVAGYDTTSYSLSFLLYELASRPELVNKIRTELLASTEDFSPMLSRCIKESMRLWPVAALGSARSLTEPLDLGNGRVLPAGAICSIPFYPLFRSMDIPFVNEFRPERWLDENQLPLLNSGVLPFSIGKRNCVGQSLASAELKLVATSILKHYSLELVTPFHTTYFLTLKPTGGAVRLRRRLSLSHH